MGNHDYMSLGNKGVISINCVSVPDKGFLDAVKTKDIAKIKILSAKDKELMEDYIPGGPDILVHHITGEREYMRRSDVSKKFMHASGNKIKMSVLKNDKWYIVYCITKTPYKVMKLPNNCSAMLPDGSPAKRGAYIVCMQDPNGQVIRETMKDIPPNVFRKMFKIPIQPVIKRHMEGNGSKLFTLFNGNRQNRNNFNRTVQNHVPEFDSSELNMNPGNINIPTVGETKTTPTFRPKVSFGNSGGAKKSFGSLNTGNTNNTPVQNKYPFTVVSRLTDMDGHLVGYVLKEIKSGKTKNVKPNDLAKFCAAKAVDNVMLVTREDGVQFLKGNGIRLENLPAVLL